MSNQTQPTGPSDHRRARATFAFTYVNQLIIAAAELKRTRSLPVLDRQLHRLELLIGELRAIINQYR